MFQTPIQGPPWAMSNMPEWKFKPFAEDDTKENPLQSQFFTTDQVGSIANGLIREGIQNALDERADASQPVTVKITIVEGINALTPDEYSPYFRDLEKHLEASKLLGRPDLRHENMSLILLEDFNTNGLRGNPKESRDDEIDDPTRHHNFYYFWRNVGITGKPENKLGRWGVGKTVFPASSRIHTFFGYTIQGDTRHHLLLGQCIVRKHNLRDTPAPWGYKPYGYYGEYLPDNHFPYPIDDATFLEEFRSVFRLKRGAEPGLSLIIPFFNPEISIDRLFIAVIQQYFFPILKGDLKVILANDDNVVYEIQKESFEQCLRKAEHVHFDDEVDSLKFDLQNFRKLCEFAKWALHLGQDEFISLKPLRLQLKPAWQEGLWQGMQLEALIEQFENDHRIAFRVPVKFHNRLKENSPKVCWFKVFLEQDEDLKGTEDHFIRDNITIVGVHSPTVPGVRAIVLIDDMDLTNLLGDSENPAHTEWQTDSENFKNKYTDGDKCISFIVRSPQKLAIKIRRPAVGYDREILNGIFFLPEAQETQKTRELSGSHKPGKSSGRSEVPSIDASPSPIRLRSLEGGFILEGSDSVSEGQRLVVEMAYRTSRGNPLRNYNPLDFELQKRPIEIRQTGVVDLRSKGNRLEFEVEEIGFSIRVTGFDKRRDLFIRVISHEDISQEV